MPRTKKAVTQLAEATSLVNGLTNSPPAGVKSVIIKGQSFTIAQLITQAEGVETVNQTAADSKATWKVAQLAAKAASKANRTTLTNIRRVLIEVYGSDTAGLTACGIVVTPRAPRTSKTNTIAAARALETRKVNGTGKKTPAPAPTITVTETNGQVIGAPAATAPVAGNAAPAVVEAAPAAAK